MSYILITNKPKHNQFIISSKNKLFLNEYLLFKQELDKITISTPSIDRRFGLLKTGKNNQSKDWYTLSVTADFLPIGKFEISDEESNEDEIIIYLE